MKKEEMKITELYDLTHTLASDYLKQFTYPWEALAGLSNFIIELGNSLDPAEYEKRGENIWVHKTAKVFDSAYLHGPVIVGKDAEVRHCAFVRGSALIGESAVVGNSTELKNVILFDKVQVPHYNYVGDSILGYKSHMGAGSITSNVKSDKLLVEIHAEDGCGSIPNPGSIIGRGTNIYPLSSVRGGVDANSIYKKQGEVAKKEESCFASESQIPIFTGSLH